MRITEEHLAVVSHCEVGVLGHLRALVPSDRAQQRSRQALDHPMQRLDHRRAVTRPGQTTQQHVARGLPREPSWPKRRHPSGEQEVLRHLSDVAYR